jgi:hypothetical protein
MKVGRTYSIALYDFLASAFTAGCTGAMLPLVTTVAVLPWPGDVLLDFNGRSVTVRGGGRKRKKCASSTGSGFFWQHTLKPRFTAESRGEESGRASARGPGDGSSIRRLPVGKRAWGLQELPGNRQPVDLDRVGVRHRSEMLYPSYINSDGVEHLVADPIGMISGTNRSGGRLRHGVDPRD